MNPSDLLLECEIDRAYELFIVAPTTDLQREYFGQMRDLIAQRSPEQIERMETERGLR